MKQNSSGRRDVQLSADRPNQRIRDLSMPRDGRTACVGRVLEDDRVALPLANQFAAVAYQMTDQITAFHGVGALTCCETFCPV